MLAGRFASNDLRYRDEDHPNQTALTPGYVLDPVREALGGTIWLDPCTTPDNPVGAMASFFPPVDGAAQDWSRHSTIFVNPPYGKARERWVSSCIHAGAFGCKVILLIPAATDTRCFQRAVASAGRAVLIRGRVKFGTLRPNRRQIAASHPSALIGWNVDLAPCAHLGLLISTIPHPPLARLCGESEENA